MIMGRGPSDARRGWLSRERVLRAALTVADGEGLAAVSMRRVAEELGVESMALYRYTASKEDLLDGLVETLFLELEDRVAAAGPRPGLRSTLHGLAREMYRVAVAHPNIVSLCATRPLMVPLARRPHAVLRVHERLLALLLATGLEGQEALRVYRAFLAWVLGYIVIDLRAVVDDPDEPDPAFRLGLHRLPARDLPILRAYGPALAERGGEEQLAAGLDALLASLDPEGG